ncbi:major facilitator superfamily domain-containing protein [Aspergillus pseudocaelatus]|uniref:Major facilitator superfamily domain-containing protein n=1 Tax=Aspergillus pseudocaelatus TaxID=1825620 RepID=A0ABQ6W132_9EURO|nr:major facilitator superfamily domain-containing protein [Aspergillus pseudocaelatus]
MKPAEADVINNMVEQVVVCPKLSPSEDEAMRAFDDGRDLDVRDIDDATNTRLLKVIDKNLLPLLCLIYGLNFVDKTTLSYASVMGLQTDLNLKGNEYQWLGSIFYFGYILVEYPSSYLMQRFPLAKYSSFNIILWGATLTCFAAVNNFAGAATVRFFLGVFEAVVTPGFTTLTSQWYTKREQGSRVGFWFSCNGVANVVGGLIAYGISRGVEQHGPSIQPWRILFLSFGLFTIAVGVAFLYYIPDNQWNCRFLSPADRVLAVQRIRGNQQGIGNRHFKMYQFKEALTDPMTWAFAFFGIAVNIPFGGITTFFSQIIRNSGYTSQQSLLYATPGGAFQTIVVVLNGIISDRLQQRIYVSFVGMIIGLLGAILLAALPLSNSPGRLAAYFLTQASPTAFIALLSFISTNVAGATKKTTVGAIYMVAYCVGNIIGPQTFQQSDAPRYIPAEIGICCCWGACLLDLLLIRYLYCKRNAEKARVRSAPGYEKPEKSEFKDLTDRENPELVYVV